MLLMIPFTIPSDLSRSYSGIVLLNHDENMQDCSRCLSIAMFLLKLVCDAAVAPTMAILNPMDVMFTLMPSCYVGPVSMGTPLSLGMHQLSLLSPYSI